MSSKTTPTTRASLRHGMPTDADARADEFAKSKVFNQLRRDLRALGYELRIVGEEAARGVGLRGGIQTWADPDADEKILFLSVAADSRIEDALRWGAAALAKLQGFPPDDNDIEAHALIQAFAYTYAAGPLSRRPAMLQLARIRDRLSHLVAAGQLTDRDRRLAALNIWASLSVLTERDRERIVEQFERMDEDLVEELNRIQRRWGLLAPVTPTAAHRMLDEPEFEQPA